MDRPDAPKPAPRSPLAPTRPVRTLERDLSAGIFGQRILQRAAHLGLGRQDLAERAGVSRQTLNNVLKLGDRSPHAHMPSVRTLLALATSLKVHPFWLVDGLMAHARVSMHLQLQHAGDRTGFVEDISAPDACVVAPGQHFHKGWSAQNLNRVTWEGRRVICWDTEVDVRAVGPDGIARPVQRLVPDALEVPMGSVVPGGVFARSIGFTAPMEPGPAVSYWMLVEPDGRPSFDENIAVWVVVYVEPDPVKRAAWARALDDRELPAIDLSQR